MEAPYCSIAAVLLDVNAGKIKVYTKDEGLCNSIFKMMGEQAENEETVAPFVLTLRWCGSKCYGATAGAFMLFSFECSAQPITTL